MHRNEKHPISNGIIMEKVSIDYRPPKKTRAEDEIRGKHGH